jgi:bifunctional non-homologous end joining protein LigD
VPWPKVVVAAKLVRERLSSVGLKSFLKTTGGKGLHVVAPLSHRCLACREILHPGYCSVMAADAPDDFIAKSSKAARRGKIFIDYLRNQRGATLCPIRRATPGQPYRCRWTERTHGSLRSMLSVTDVAAGLSAGSRSLKEFFTIRQTIDASCIDRAIKPFLRTAHMIGHVLGLWLSSFLCETIAKLRHGWPRLGCL